MSSSSLHVFENIPGLVCPTRSRHHFENSQRGWYGLLPLAGNTILSEAALSWFHYNARATLGVGADASCSPSGGGIPL